MIDLSKERLFTLKQDVISEAYASYMIDNEELLFFFSGKRDGIAFTSKRIMCFDAQGITGKKLEVSSFPYSKINGFSTESAGAFDRDMEIEILVNGMGKLKIRLSANTDVVTIGRFLAERIL